jgi:hypothetical protein
VTATSAAAERRSAELVAVVADAVACVEPELPAGAVAAALEQVGRLRRPRLAAWLVGHPDGLVSGASTAPKVVAEFIAALQRQGPAGWCCPPARAAAGRWSCSIPVAPSGSAAAATRPPGSRVGPVDAGGR